jgi:hypothetical protein
VSTSGHNLGTKLIFSNIRLRLYNELLTFAKTLGHSDIRTTLRYCHPTLENKRKAVDVLRAVFKEKNPQLDKIWTQPSVENDLTHSITNN